MINKFQNSSIVKRIENTQNRMGIVNPQIVTNIVSKGREVLDSLYNRSKPQTESTYVYTPVTLITGKVTIYRIILQIIGDIDLKKYNLKSWC